MYAALLMLSKQLNKQQKIERADQVICELELERLLLQLCQHCPQSIETLSGSQDLENGPIVHPYILAQTA